MASRLKIEFIDGNKKYELVSKPNFPEIKSVSDIKEIDVIWKYAIEEIMYALMENYCEMKGIDRTASLVNKKLKFVR